MGLRLRHVVVLLFAVAAVAAQHGTRKLPPDYEKKMAAIKNFEAGVAPLFVVGDLNEDGVVDNADLALMERYLEKKSIDAENQGLTCLAAADLNMNGQVEARDLGILREILRHGAVQAPALSHRSRLGCDYRNFVIAASPGAMAGGTVPIHFLDPKYTPQNSSAQVSTAEATVSKTADGFLVRLAKNAKPGSVVTVAITLAGGRKYLYTLAVVPSPRP